MAPTWRTARFLQRHRWVALVLHRVPATRAWMSRRVWAEALSDPAFVAGLERGRADFAAGRLVRWEDVRP